MKFSKGIGFVAIIIAIAVLGAIGGGIYMVTQNNASPDDGEGVVENEAMVETSSNTSLRNLIALGQNLVCTFERVDANTNTSGTIYLASSGEQIRGDFTVITDVANPINAHMIKQDNYIYTWSDVMNQGSKIEADIENDPLENDTVGLDDEAEYTCKGWSVDSAKFNLPSNIDFVDISAFTQTNIDASEGIDLNQCAMCDVAPDENSRAQCRAALGC